MPILDKSVNPSTIRQSITNPMLILDQTVSPRISQWQSSKQDRQCIGTDWRRLRQSEVQYGRQSRSGTGNKITVEVWPKCLDGGRLRKSRLQYFYTPTANLRQSTNPMSILDQSANHEPIYRRYMTNLQIAGQWNTNLWWIHTIRCQSSTN